MCNGIIVCNGVVMCNSVIVCNRVIVCNGVVVCNRVIVFNSVSVCNSAIVCLCVAMKLLISTQSSHVELFIIHHSYCSSRWEVNHSLGVSRTSDNYEGISIYIYLYIRGKTLSTVSSSVALQCMRVRVQYANACNAYPLPTFLASTCNSKPIPLLLYIQWNPKPEHHVLAVGVGKCVVLLATGTGGPDASAITEALLQATTPSNSSSKGGGAPEKRSGKEQEPEESSQSGSDEGDDEGDGVGVKTAGKKTSPVKWEVVFSKKGRARRSEGAADREEVQVGPRIVLRCVRVMRLSRMVRRCIETIIQYLMVPSNIYYLALD